MKQIFITLTFLLTSLTLFAQEEIHLLDVFISPAQNQFEFFRSEINFVNFVSDRQLCDVQWQSIEEPVGNGAVRYRYLFFGYRKFEGQNDTITWHSEVGENPGSIREKSLIAFKQGLLPFLLQTPLAQGIEYKVSPKFDPQNTPDPWNKWTFKPGFGLNGRSAYLKDSNPNGAEVENKVGNLSLRPSFSFWHVSEKWRLNGSVNYNYQQAWQRLNNVSQVNDKQSSLSLSFGGVYSINQQWSVGLGASRVQFWDHANGSNAISQAGLGVEYSFLPYEDYFRQRLVVGYTWLLPIDESDAIEIPEIILRNHQLYGAYAKTAKWGYFLAELSSRVDYKVLEWFNFELSSNIGLGINVGKNIYTTLIVVGNWSNNQQNLSSGLPNSPTRKLTMGNVIYNLGIDYYFGSGYRNVVNPRRYAANQYF